MNIVVNMDMKITSLDGLFRRSGFGRYRIIHNTKYEFTGFSGL